MKKMIVIYGPQGCGKTLCKDLLAAHYGADVIADNFIPLDELNRDSHRKVLVLTNLSNRQLRSIGIKNAIPFYKALHDINAEEQAIQRKARQEEMETKIRDWLDFNAKAMSV